MPRPHMLRSNVMDVMDVMEPASEVLAAVVSGW
jgi:hypothetical protein